MYISYRKLYLKVTFQAIIVQLVMGTFSGHKKERRCSGLFCYTLDTPGRVTQNIPKSSTKMKKMEYQFQPVIRLMDSKKFKDGVASV